MFGHIVDKRNDARNVSIVVEHRALDQLHEFLHAIGVDLDGVRHPLARAQNLPVGLHRLDRVLAVLADLEVGLAADRPVGVVAHLEVMPVVRREHVAPLGVFQEDVRGQLAQHRLDFVVRRRALQANRVLDALVHEGAVVWRHDDVDRAFVEAARIGFGEVAPGGDDDGYGDERRVGRRVLQERALVRHRHVDVDDDRRQPDRALAHDAQALARIGCGQHIVIFIEVAAEAARTLS